MLLNLVIGQGWVLSIFCGKSQRGWMTLFSLAFLGGCGGGGDFLTGNPGGQPLTLTLPPSYSLKWADDFSTDGAPGPAWGYDLGTGDLAVLGSVWGNSERQFYTSESRNVSVSGGLLTIQPLPGVPAEAPQNLNLLATSARIKTDTAAYYNALNPTPYGFYEIRAKVPCIGGAWPAVWMMGKDGNWPERGEIDIMEWFGRYFANDVNQVQSGVHTRNNPGANSIYRSARVNAMCTQFHNFQLHWTASEILIGVNGVPTFSYKRPANATVNNWPFDQPAHLILNVAVGGNLGGDVNTANISSMALKVDYVKIWQP